jgi:hypothetical protein
MKKLLEKCGIMLANIIIVTLVGTLAWGILLAVGNTFEIDVINQLLLP